MQIIEMKISELKADKNNAKKHPPEQIEQIKNSIIKFGFNDPIGIWGEQNLLVEGHGRLIAAKKLNMLVVPCVRLDHLTDEERKAYMLIHNKTTMNSDFDFDILQSQLDGLKINFDMSLFGFSEMDNIVPDIEKKELQPYKKVHYLITCDINENDRIIKYIDKIKEEGAEVDSTLN